MLCKNFLQKFVNNNNKTIMMLIVENLKEKEKEAQNIKKK